MNKYSFLGLAAILLAAGNAAKAYAEGAEAPATDTAETGGEDAPKRRGRPPGKPAEEKAAEPAQDDAARFEANRALIKPLVDASQGEDVKKVIAKYSKTGLKDVPAASQADFEKDIAALAY